MRSSSILYCALLLLELLLLARAAPYYAAPLAVPGRIEAEDYDRGGPGVAYFDTDDANNGGSYRPAESVDVQASTDGTFNVGWTAPGEWIKYTVNINAAGAYRFELRVAAAQDVGAIQLSLNGNALGNVAVPNTGAWTTWQTVVLNNVALPAGQAQLTVTFTGAAGGPNFNWIDVLPVDYVAPPAPQLPTGLDPAFFDQVFVGGLTAPTDMAFASDGRIFISEKQGTIRVWKNGALLPTPFINLIDEVQNAGDKGLLSIALHPFFTTNNWIYLLYAVDPVYGQPDETEFTPVLHRLVRYTVNGDVADPNSRTIILGKSLAEGFTSCASTHTSGKMRFAPDNTLMFTFGDGGHYEYMDLGGDTACVNGGFITAAQDIGAFRSQSLGALQGKVLRIDPDTGLGVPTNPWYDPTNVIQSRIWALGFRNPFRWSFKPTDDGSIILLVGDVGNADFEDATEVHEGGNAGWPCYEGRRPAPGYYAARPDFCKDVATLIGTPRWPILDFSHLDAADSYPVGMNGNAITSVTTYVGKSYPPAYQGAVFISDHSHGWVSAFWIDFEKRHLNANVIFNPNAVSAITIESSPAIYNEDLFYLNLNAGQLRRIGYGNAPPAAEVAASPTCGSIPLTVQFSSDGTFDAQGRAFTLLWDFGDGTTSTVPNPVHTYMTSGAFQAKLTITAGTQSAFATVAINTQAPHPVVRVSQPAPFSSYPPGTKVTFAADLSANTAPVTLTWELQLVHNAHYHPQTEQSVLASPSWTLDGNLPDGQRQSYRVIAYATNSAGCTTDDMLSVTPAGSPNGAPVAAFILSANAGNAPLPVTVDSLGSADPDGDLMFFTWNWGDGTLEAEGVSARHIYAYGGTYTITLTAMDNYGTKSTATRQVTVTGAAAPPTTAPPTLPPSTKPTATTPAPTTTVPSPPPSSNQPSASPSPSSSQSSSPPSSTSSSPTPSKPSTTRPDDTAQSDEVFDVLILPVARNFAGNVKITKELHLLTTATSSALLTVAGTLTIAPEAHLNITLSDTPKDGQLFAYAQANLISGNFASASVSSPGNNSCTLITGHPEASSSRASVLFQVESFCHSKHKRKVQPWLIGLLVAVAIIAAALTIAAVALWQSAKLRQKAKNWLCCTKPEQSK